MAILKEEITANTLDSLYGVGPRKPLGYLPLNTVTRHLGFDVGEVETELRSRGLGLRVFFPNECEINSGAIYAFDASALQRVLDEERPILEQNGWPSAIPKFIERVANDFLDVNHPLYPVIARAFGEHVSEMRVTE